MGLMGWQGLAAESHNNGSISVPAFLYPGATVLCCADYPKCVIPASCLNFRLTSNRSLYIYPPGCDPEVPRTHVGYWTYFPLELLFPLYSLPRLLVPPNQKPGSHLWYFLFLFHPLWSVSHYILMSTINGDQVHPLSMATSASPFQLRARAPKQQLSWASAPSFLSFRSALLSALGKGQRVSLKQKSTTYCL